MDASRSFEEIVGHLRGRRVTEVELYLKDGRSHRVEMGPQGPIETRCEEAGWAVRAGGDRGSFFCCGTSRPEPGGPWPEVRGEPLRLPAVWESTPVETPATTRPLIVESEAVGLLTAFERALQSETADGRVVRAVLEDGVSTASLASTRGLERTYSHRTATLYLEVKAGTARRSAQYAARAAADFDPRALARRLATLLGLVRDGAIGPAGRGPTVLAPAVATRVLAGLLPALIGVEGSEAVRSLGRGGRFGSPKLTVIDDGRLSGGPLEAAVDGEGVPTREVVLVEEGIYRQPLLSWQEAAASRRESSGCRLRSSWREPPALGPTHLFVRPERDVSPAELVGSVAAGFYWLDVLGPGRFDLLGDQFELPVCGFQLVGGRATAPIAAARLRGTVSGLLNGISSVARDLTFLPLGYFLGSPTLLIDDLELDAACTPG